MSIKHRFLLLFSCILFCARAQDKITELIMESIGKHSSYKQALRLPLKAKKVFIENYKDSVFPNAEIMSFQNVEYLGIRGEFVYRNDSLVVRSLRFDSLKLQQLTHLKGIFIEGFDLGHFPEALCALPQLKGLTLSLCKITEISPGIARLKELTYIECRLNRLQALPPGLFTLPKLEVLDLANNRFTTLPEGLTLLPALRKLNFSNVESDYYVAADAKWPFEQNINRIHYPAQYALLKKLLEAEHFDYFFLSVPTCFEGDLLNAQLTEDGLRKVVEIRLKGCE